MPRKSIHLSSAVLVLLTIAGCNTPRTTTYLKNRALYNAQHGRLDQARADLNDLYDCKLDGEPKALGKPASEGEVYKDKHALIWHTERSLLDLWELTYGAGRDHLSRARALVEEFRAKDLVSGFTSAVANDTARDYIGEGFEHDYIDYLSAVEQLLVAQQAAERYLPGHIALFVPELDPNGQRLPIAASEPTATDGSSQIPLDAIAEPNAAYDQAINAMRGLTEYTAKMTADAAGGRRYHGNAYLHAMAAAVAMAHPKPLASDLDYAEAMLIRAAKLQEHSATAFTGDPKFNWETRGMEGFIDDLRLLLAYRRGGAYLKEALAERQTTVADLQASGRLPKEDQAPVLLVNHVDYISKPEVLDIRMFTGTAPIATERETERGIEVETFNLGAVGFYAKGPGADIVNHWGVLPVPGKLTEALGNGISVIGFAMPVHAPDRRVGESPMAILLKSGEQNAAFHNLPIVDDPDAYARATLKDEQPQVLTKTLTRTLVKQIAAHVASNEVRKQAGAIAGFFTQLVTSSAATASEIADTRAITMLPNHVRAKLAFAPAGAFEAHVNDGWNERTIGRGDLRADRLTIIPFRSWTASLAEPKR